MDDLAMLKQQRDRLLKKKFNDERAVIDLMERAALRKEIRALGEDPVA
ncbi:MAG: hypothetical protein ACRCSX_10420 [Allorhizobium sp.]